MSASRAVVLVCSLSVLGACETEPGIGLLPGRDGGPRRDAGRDGGVDASAGEDASAVEVDSGARERECERVVDTLLEESIAYGGAPVIAAGADRFAIAWEQTASAYRGVAWDVVPSAGPIELAPQDVGQAASAGSPTLAATPSGFVLAWFANPTLDHEIWALALDAEGAPVSLATRWTTRPGRDDRPQLATLGPRLLAGWVGGPEPMASVARATAGATLEGAPHELAGGVDAPLDYRLVALGEGALAAWTLGGDVVGATLDAEGAGVGLRGTLSTEGGADGTLDLASADERAALVFGVSAAGGQVRGRVLDVFGAPVGAERILAPVTSAGTARGPSIARFGAGWVAAYRASDDTGSRIELAFLDASLGVGSRIVLAEALAAGVTRIAVSGDGRVGVAWSDVDDAGTRVRLARLDCE